MIVGTAGHIDHGKTTLVRALTGVDTDRLKEEKARGISIELGYAYVPLANGGMLGFVDVPGHERLIHTMTAGATGIDFALLVIAADDGVMPQTREHLAILDLLAVARGAVALTKADRVDADRLDAVRGEVDSLLATSALQSAPSFAVNALDENDEGIVALRDHLHAAATHLPARAGDGLFRLAVDRVFSLPGHGTIATGTVHAGTVQVGDTIQAMPAGLAARVRGIHANHSESDAGRAGQRCAINLAGIDRTQLTRGDWLADPRVFVSSARVDVRLRVLHDAAMLRMWAPVHVHLGTTDRLAHLVPLDAETIGPGTSARVQLVFDAPVCSAAGDRFIVRDAQAQRTLGGGRVLDANAPARKRRSAARVAHLDAVERVLDGDGLGALLRSAAHGLAIADLERICAAPASSLPLPADARMLETRHGAYVLAEARWQALRDAVLAALCAFHEQSPDDAGIDSARLRRIVAPTMPDALWRVLIDALIADARIARSGAWLHLPGHRVALSAEEVHLAQRLAPVIAAGGYDPPWVRDLAKTLSAPESQVRQTLRKLSAQGAVHQVVPDLFYDAGRVRELAVLAAQLADGQGEIEAGAFRDHIGLGRKRAIQILEFFDRVGYTRRVRQAHRLRDGQDDFF